MAAMFNGDGIRRCVVCSHLACTRLDNHTAMCIINQKKSKKIKKRIDSIDFFLSFFYHRHRSSKQVNII